MTERDRGERRKWATEGELEREKLTMKVSSKFKIG